MNAEGYRDPTADQAVRHVDRTPDHVMEVIHALRIVASLAGFEIVDRIALRDKASGKEYR